MKVPLRDYLSKKPENLKVFVLKAKAHIMHIDIRSFVEKYGFDPSYDRFSYRVVPANNTEFPPAFSHILLCRLNVEDDWFLFAYLYSDGFIEVKCNDEELARGFYENVIVGGDAHRYQTIDYEWTNDINVVAYYLANMGTTLEKIGKATPRLKELYTLYTQFEPSLKGLFKEKRPHTLDRYYKREKQDCQ